MAPRVIGLVIAAVALAAVGGAVGRARGSDAPSTAEPVTVGSVRIAAAEIEAAAARIARNHPDLLEAARRAAAARAIERVWLQGEAAARGLRPAARMGVLRAQVADALAGPGRPPDAARLAAEFGAFHERWRAVTRCLPAYHDPYEDRCGEIAGAVAGSCRWMGEATVCGPSRRVRARWVVVHDASPARATRAAAELPLRLASRLRPARRGVVRLRSRADALAVARAVYVVAREARARAAAAAHAAAKRRADERRRAAERARIVRERQARVRDPRLASESLLAARDACERQLRDSDPYMFAFGMQDVEGQVEGLTAVRAAFARRALASAVDAIDRRKLRSLAEAVAAGNHELERLAVAGPPSDLGTLADRLARLDARTEPERAVSRRLGLGDCLARPRRAAATQPSAGP